MQDFLNTTRDFAASRFAVRVFGLGDDVSKLPTADPATIVGDILKVILGLLGIIFTVLVIWGAIKWMLSRGEEEQVKGAKDLIINATIGLALAVAGYTLTVLIIDVILRSVIGQPLVSP